MCTVRNVIEKMTDNVIYEPNNSKKSSTLFFILASALCTLLYLVYSLTQNLDYLILASFLLFLGAYIASVKISNPVSIYPGFLALSFLFLYSRVFLDLIIPNYDFGNCTLFTRIVLSHHEKEKILWIIQVAIFIPTILFIGSYKRNTSQFSYKHKKPLLQAGIYIVLLTCPFVIYNLLKEAFYIFSNGYISIFNGDLENYTGTFFAKFFKRLSIFGFYCMFASLLNKKQFNYVSLALLSFVSLAALKGQRGELFLTIIFLLWYRYTVLGLKINYRALTAIVTILIFTGQYISALRSGSSCNFFEIPFQFLHLNGASICVLGYLIRSPELLNPDGVPYLFSPVVDFFKRWFIDSSAFYSGPTQERLEASNYLSWKLTNHVSPESYFQGHGTGTSFLAEFYSFGGLIGVAIWSLLFLMVSMKIERNVRNYRWALFISPIVLMAYVYMGRGSMIKCIDDLIPYCVMFVILNTLIKKIKVCN